MSRENYEDPTLDAVEAELLRSACGDGEPLSADAEARLAADPALRAEREADVALASALRDALAPEALRPELEGKIWGRIEADQPVVRAHWFGWRVLAGAAVAAAVMFGVLVPEVEAPAPVVPDGGGEGAAIVVQWDASEELEELEEDVTAISQRLEREASAETLLPWDAEDDWDLPPAEDA
jgi:hypothetical protein